MRRQSQVKPHEVFRRNNRHRSASRSLRQSACASGPSGTRFSGGVPPWFHSHSLSLIGSLFLHIRIYEFPNGGFWYDFGFVSGFVTSLLTVFLTFMARIGGMVT